MATCIYVAGYSLCYRLAGGTGFFSEYIFRSSVPSSLVVFWVWARNYLTMAFRYGNFLFIESIFACITVMVLFIFGLIIYI